MSWFTRLIGVDKVVAEQISKVLEGSRVPRAKDNPHLIDYRSEEYRVWASSNTAQIMEFYKQTYDPSQYADRLLFWKWVGGRDVPKNHYPAPEALINHIKSLLFGNDITIEVEAEGESEEQRKTAEEITARLYELFEDVNFYELLQKAALMETYSGTIGFKFIVDKEVSDTPIVEVYPKERLELVTKYNRVLEIVFKDYYQVKTKHYVLRSYYGKGYIKYELFNDKDKKVPLSTVSELSELEDLVFDKKIMLAAYKKNKATSNEFSDTPYGGSDFEGILDLLHSIDEVYSNMMLYIRRMRPMISVTEDLLPVNLEGSGTIMPKEYEFDVVKLRPSDNAKDIGARFYRDAPELKVDPYIDSINQLLKSVYQKVGMSYTSVGLEAHSANISGAALIEKEKPTIILRNNKIKLWVPALKEFSRLLLAYDDLIKTNILGDYSDLGINVVFPDYVEESFEDKVERLGKAQKEGFMDNLTANEELHDGRYDEEKIKQISRNAKIEQGMTLMPQDLELVDE